VRMRANPPVRRTADDNELHVLGEAFEDMADRVEEHQEELYRRNVELEQVLKRLQRADQVKDELLSFLSHEMRTPLTAIRSFAELLRTTKDVSEDERQEFLSIIENECHRLELLSNDLLDLARIDLGEMPWRDQLIDPGRVIDDAARILRILAERGGAHLLLQVQPDLPKMRLDRDRMIQVLTNLVSNSLKYTPAEGQVTIRAERELDGDREWLRVSVIDTGPGIPMQSLESVFDPFVQAGDEAGRQGGAGLGLTICARIVQHYGGTIHAENGAHGGAIMRVRVPAAPCTIGVTDAVLQ